LTRIGVQALAPAVNGVRLAPFMRPAATSRICQRSGSVTVREARDKDSPVSSVSACRSS